MLSFQKLCSKLKIIYKKYNNRYLENILKDSELVKNIEEIFKDNEYFKEKIKNGIDKKLIFREKTILLINGLKDIPKCLYGCCKNYVNFSTRVTNPYSKYCCLKCRTKNTKYKSLISKNNNLKNKIDFSSFNTKKELKKEILKINKKKKTNSLLYLKNNNSLKKKLDIFFKNIKHLKLCTTELISLLMNDFSEPLKCKICEKYLIFSGRIKKPYNKAGYCSLKCSNNSKEVREKYKKSCLKNYGVDHNMKSKKVQEKFKKTIERKYGFGITNPMQVEKIKNKTQETCLKKFGHKSILNTKKIIERNRIKRFSNHKNNIIKKLGKQYEFLSYDNKTSLVKIKHLFKTNGEICGKEFKILNNTLNSRYLYNIEYCVECFPLNKSYSFLEKQLLEGIKNKLISNILIKENLKLKKLGINSNLEIDMYIPKIKLGIEFNGIYWHSQNKEIKNKKSFLIKNKIINQNNIRLLNINEFEYLNNTKIIYSLILKKIYKRDKKMIKNDKKYEYINKPIKNIDKIDFSIKKTNNLNKINKKLEEHNIFGSISNNNKLYLFELKYKNKTIGNIVLQRKEENYFNILRYNLYNNIFVEESLFSIYFNLIKNEFQNIKKYFFKINKLYFNGENLQKIGFKIKKELKQNATYFKLGKKIQKYSKKDILKKIDIKNDNIVINSKSGKLNNKDIDKIIIKKGYNILYDCGLYLLEYNNVGFNKKRI